MHINELSKPLNQYFNFTHLATAFMIESFPQSRDKRVQRSFRFLKFDPFFAVAYMVIMRFALKNRKLSLALDRTN